jgi:hypothetical protein
VLRMLWGLGISAIPPEAAPYMTGQYVMDTNRLRQFLGADWERVIRHTSGEAFVDCFATRAATRASRE